MRIEGVVWLWEVSEKIERKHGVHTEEVEEMLARRPLFRKLEKGRRRGENVYLALGQTAAGRYLAAIFIWKRTREALILSARDMAPKERHYHAKNRQA